MGDQEGGKHGEASLTKRVRKNKKIAQLQSFPRIPAEHFLAVPELVVKMVSGIILRARIHLPCFEEFLTNQRRFGFQTQILRNVV